MKRLLRNALLLILGVILAIAPGTTSFSAVPATDVNSESSSALERITALEEDWRQDYETYLGDRGRVPLLSPTEIEATLQRLSSETAKNLALIYVSPDTTQLEVVLVIPGRPPLRHVLPTVSQDTLREVLTSFRSWVTRPIGSRRSLAAGRQLYEWIIAPLEETLQANAIDTLIFCAGANLRSTPLAALYDGQQFLVEKYSIGLIPAVSLTNLNHAPLANAQILAMGASQFQRLTALPAVPIELATITQNQQTGTVFLNQAFTLRNLRRQLASGEFKIVHLATHAEFRPGSPDESYIQLWERDRLELDNLRRLAWDELPVELLVLSACQTALGDQNAELGFAGLSFQAGVKSSLASLWRVSDLGTLALMQEFYWQLARPDVTTKAEALRRTQIALLRKQVYVENNQLHSSAGVLPLPDDLGANLTFETPFYWAAFTLVGSPW